MASKLLFLIFALFLLSLPACRPAAVSRAENDVEAPAQSPSAADTSQPAPVQEAGESSPDLPVSTNTPAAHSCEDPFGETRLRFNVNFWPNTDFCRHSVPYGEFLSGGPPPDGIPPIDSPVFESVVTADEWLEDSWPVMYFEWGGVARAYPLAILVWHEIVNDTVAGRPVTLTFCPLCNATIAFDRTLPDGRVLDFGTSGNLRNSDLVMYDRQTYSWWQQFTGEAVVGELTGQALTFLPSQIIAWADFKGAYSNSEVLSRDTGHIRTYGSNPYAGYDDINNNPFLFDGVVDGRLPAMERVVAVRIDKNDVAYPFSTLEQVQVVNDEVGGVPLVVFWKGDTASAFDQSTFSGPAAVGSSAVFDRRLEEYILTFEAFEDGFRDLETGSLWNIFGKAVEGDLAGSELVQVVSAEHFWFSWAAFRPATVIWEVGGK